MVTPIEQLDLRLPIAQAPMASATTPEMVIAVCRAGGLGAHGVTYLDADALGKAIAEIRAGTDRPFVCNLFVPEETRYSDAALARASDALAPFREELDLAAPNARPAPSALFDDQIAVLIAERVPAVSFHFGLPPQDVIDAVKAAGIVVLCSATNPDDARRAEAAGIDIVIAQSAEAGGHQGTFSVAEEPPGIPTMALVPAVVDAVSVPVFAAGGIVDGRGIAAVLALGATAAQLGTAFVPCPESVAHPAHKAALLDAGRGRSRLTRAFTGRPARGLPNRFMTEFDEAAALPFPHQNLLTGPVRAAASERNEPEFLALWAGSGAPLARALPAGELVAVLARETEAAISSMAGRARRR